MVLLLSAVLCAVLLAVVVLGIRRSLVVVQVRGHSMAPAYRNRDCLLARRAGPREARRGAVVVLAPREAEAPGSAALTPGQWLLPAPGQWLVKRVAAVPGDQVPACVASVRPELADSVIPPGCLIVLGDNQAYSRDSREEGLVSAERVRAVVLRRLTGLSGPTAG